MRKLSVILVMAVLAMMVVGTGLAQAETWTFSVPNGDVGSNSHPYDSTPTGTTITATGELTTVASPISGTWSPGALTAIHLYGKTGGGTETGLGILAPPLGTGTDSDNEIVNKSFVLLDVSNLITKSFNFLTLSIGSIQSGEGYSLWTGTSGSPLTLLRLKQNTGAGSISDVADGIDTFTLPLTFGSLLWVSATPTTDGSDNSDILIRDGASTVPIPIPGAVWLLGSGLVGLAGLRRKLKS